tara:strand:+ start:667 stop:1119 length:453 start_codon:yes stop_codon:yes gene_type:complete
MKLKRSTIRKLVIQEINKMKEDSLRTGFDDPDRQSYHQNKNSNSSTCTECGSSMYEGESVCEQCGSSSLNESDCGCGACAGCNSESNNTDNNYMAKPSLYKVAKYAQKLLEMIPDGYELDDWQRTKIAQISDDISEVYHSLDYDKFEGDL